MHSALVKCILMHPRVRQINLIYIKVVGGVLNGKLPCLVPFLPK
jgi:hypothetical protein